ncbi:DNA damage-inducible protein DinB [Tenacibaculum discolor]|uniref:DNA damage-inducible protein DinB n=1 Tax=Tenacibaculum discolor TaxID=361581 RepID=A0A2G1BUI2_9FLAO|nr:DinB family protein [Tenacibaculum discolor]MDP2541961.1 DinB family protein [Tenacibaculum discolor]PHN97624.1 DNA damage-inducible protein DinB [Tenacibaculum discolor]PHN99381.1 DNA damage-inducible protein DinB [Rhodobacteraceae bacterium 4F10]
MIKHIEFPLQNEYPSYAEMYMKLVKKDGSLIEQLKSSLHKTKSLINNLSNDELDYRYEKNKWSIKEVLVHIIDDERIYGYRALSFARNDKTNLPGFEQEDYNYYSDTSERTIENILEEYEALRLSTIALFNGLSDKSLKRIGIANGNRASARALGYHILGHELHHIKTIENLYLKELKK